MKVKRHKHIVDGSSLRITYQLGQVTGADIIILLARANVRIAFICEHVVTAHVT